MTLSVPIYTPDYEVQAFLKANETWVLEHRASMLKRMEEKHLCYLSGERHAFFGTYYPLEVRPASVREYAAFEEDKLVIYAQHDTSEAHRRQLLYQFYFTQLKPVFQGLMDKWTRLLGHADAHITFRLMRSEWGSCTAAKNHLTFNVDLARVPIECIEYVVVHELTHFDYQNHSHAFWCLLDERLCTHGLLLDKEHPSAVPAAQHAIRLRKQLNTFVLAF